MSELISSQATAELATDDARLVDRFIERIWSEDGLAERTLEAYRRDLQGLSRWLGTRGKS
ncbi:MAG: site-specific integrase, partial [Luteibacter sp.]